MSILVYYYVGIQYTLYQLVHSLIRAQLAWAKAQLAQAVVPFMVVCIINRGQYTSHFKDIEVYYDVIAIIIYICGNSAVQ